MDSGGLHVEADEIEGGFHDLARFVAIIERIEGVATFGVIHERQGRIAFQRGR